MTHIEIVEWETFQHYKTRDPLWVKNYLHLLHKDEYLDLTGNRRAILHGLWLLYAAKHSRLRADNTAVISRALALKVTRRDLEALADAGFIRLSASKPLADRYQPAMPEKEKEKEPPNPLTKMRRPDELWDALVSEIGPVVTKDERGKRNNALKQLREAEATPEQIHERCAAYRRIWPSMSLTAKALVGNWSLLEPVSQNGHTHSCPECGIGFKGGKTLGLHRERVHGVPV